MTASSFELDNIQIASPCEVDWASMSGDERKRHCGLCKLDVYDFSAMSRSEAEALVAGAKGRLCARFARRTDGTVVTRDCGPIRRRIQRRVRRLRAAAAALFGVVSAFALNACGRSAPDTAKTPAPKETPEPPADDTPELMGIVCPTPPDAAMGEIIVVPREMGRILPPSHPRKPLPPEEDGTR